MKFNNFKVCYCSTSIGCFNHVITNLEPKFLSLFNLIEFSSFCLISLISCLAFIDSFLYIFRAAGLEGLVIFVVVPTTMSSASSSISAKAFFVVFFILFIMLSKAVQNMGLSLHKPPRFVTY